MLAPDPNAFRLDSATRVVGAFSLVAAIIVYAMALEALRREARRCATADLPVPWYFGYVRDLTNLLGLVLLGGAHYLIGFGPPLALAMAFLTGLSIYLLDYAAAHGLHLRHPTVPVVGVMILATVPTQAMPATVATLVEGLMGTLFR